MRDGVGVSMGWWLGGWVDESVCWYAVALSAMGAGAGSSVNLPVVSAVTVCGRTHHTMITILFVSAGVPWLLEPVV